MQESTKSLYQNPLLVAGEACRAGLPRPAVVGFRRGQASPPYSASAEFCYKH
jgi:hypothetical protein